jgi:3-oxoacyl-[acyl-carrier-protein] synthase II
MARAIRAALASGGLTAAEIGHINAHGLSTQLDDRLEARALSETLPGVPVTAPKSYFGNLGAGSGAVEMAVSLLSFGEKWVPPTLNYDEPDPDCRINLITGDGLSGSAPVALLVNQATSGQAVALILAGA